MRKLTTVIIVYDDGSLTIQDADTPGFVTTVQGPIADMAVEVSKRRRTKQTCPLCGEKFFSPGIGSHMKACKNKPHFKSAQEKQDAGEL